MTVRTTLLCALFVLPLTWAQFPAVCNTEDSLSTKTCCPNTCGSHGTCVSIREEVEKSWESANTTVVQVLHDMQDVRYQWPLNIFERVCSCNEGWGGYDCGHCDFGFIANGTNECVKRNTNQLRIRRNFKNLSEQERLDMIMLIQVAKNEGEEEKEWAAISSAPEEPNGHYILQNVSTYDMFTFIHFIVTKNWIDPVCPINSTVDFDGKIRFAHNDAVFLPWHRYFLLKFESELTRIGERMGISEFTLPYWDWTPTSSCLIFTPELFGTPVYSDEVVNVNGKLFEDGKWPAICDLLYRKNTVDDLVLESATECVYPKTVCDVEGDRMANRPLQRGAWKDVMIGLQLPDHKLIAMALIPDQVEDTYGFENRLEIHLQQCAGETVKCMEPTDEEINLHGAGHYTIGGQLSIGESAVNDPIFFLHHANVDRIFENWQRKFNGTTPYQPLSGGPPGHNFNDYLVPMFPVGKVSDFYKGTEEFGYIYDELPWSIPPAAADYQLGCPSDLCSKGGYPPTILVNSTSAYCTRLREDLKSTAHGGA